MHAAGHLQAHCWSCRESDEWGNGMHVGVGNLDNTTCCKGKTQETQDTQEILMVSDSNGLFSF